MLLVQTLRNERQESFVAVVGRGCALAQNLLYGTLTFEKIMNFGAKIRFSMSVPCLSHDFTVLYFNIYSKSEWKPLGNLEETRKIRKIMM